MNYPILSLPLTGGTRWSEDPRVSETRTEQLRCAMVARPKLADGELAGGDIITVGPTRPSASIALLGRPYCRR